MKELIKRILTELGEDPARASVCSRPGAVRTSVTVSHQRLRGNIDGMLNGALFGVDYSEMVMVRDIDFYSMCEHHLLPFFGKCHVAYIPKGKSDRPSKIPRWWTFSRAAAVAGADDEPDCLHHPGEDQAAGVAVVCEGTHLCMAMRGVEKQNSYTITSAMLGAFQTQQRTRMEFLELLKLRGGNLSVTGLPLPQGSVHGDD